MHKKALQKSKGKIQFTWTEKKTMFGNYELI